MTDGQNVPWRERRSLSFTADKCTGYRVWRESVSVLLLVLCLCMTGECPEKQREAFTILAQLLSPSVLQYHVDLSGKSKGWAWNAGLFRISSRFLFHNGFKLREIKGSKREMKGEGGNWTTCAQNSRKRGGETESGWQKQPWQYRREKSWKLNSAVRNTLCVCVCV